MAKVTNKLPQIYKPLLAILMDDGTRYFIPAEPTLEAAQKNLTNDLNSNMFVILNGETIRRQDVKRITKATSKIALWNYSPDARRAAELRAKEYRSNLNKEPNEEQMRKWAEKFIQERGEV